MRQADEADRRAKAANARADNAPEGSEERTQAREEARSHEKTAESAGADYGPKYDSAERRENDANRLEAKGLEKEAVSAKMHADLGNAKPATEAVKSVPLVPRRLGRRDRRRPACSVMSWDASHPTQAVRRQNRRKCCNVSCGRLFKSIH